MALPRKNSSFVLVALTLISSLPALAAPSRKAVQQEVYPATESEGGSMQAAGIARPNQAAPVKLIARVAPAKAVEAKLPDSALSYDPVPSDQIDALSKRLQLTETLIRRHARAYDYRTHTVHDLELILAKLDASVAPQASKPVAKVQSEATAQASIPIPTEADEINAGGENREN